MTNLLLNRHSHRFWCGCLGILLSLISLLAQASPINSSAGRALAEALAPDGTLRPGLSGSFDARGYELIEVAGSQQPHFRAIGTHATQDIVGAGDENWRKGFDLPGTNGTIYAMVSRGNVMYIGGDFTVVGNIVTNGVAKWDGTAWSALSTGLQSEDTRMHGAARALALDSKGNLYVGGGFVKAGDKAANDIAKWDGKTWSTLGSGVGPGGLVLSLAVDNHDKLYAGGYFDKIDGVAASNVAKWDGTTWRALGQGVNDAVYALAADTKGNLYAGGKFTWAEGSAKHLAKWNGTAWGNMGAEVDDLVTSLALDSKENLYIGGRFSTVNSNIFAKAVAKWDGTSWSKLGTGLEFDFWSSNPATTYALATDDLGNVYVSGGFSKAGNLAVDGLAKWDGAAWSTVENSSSTKPGGKCITLAVDGNGHLYTGLQYNLGQTEYEDKIYSVAKWNNQAWNILGTGINLRITAITVDKQGTVYVGGLFNNLAQPAGILNVAKWTGSSWELLGAGLGAFTYDEIRCMTTDGAGNLYVGGYFTRASGVVVNNVAKWNGSAWSALGAGLNLEVHSLVVDGKGNLYAGGISGVVGGAYISKVAKWSGSAWNTVGADLTGRISSLVVDNQNTLYAGMQISTTEGTQGSYVTKLNGSSWTSISSASTIYGENLIIDKSNTLYASGYTQIGLEYTSTVAKWNGTAWNVLGSSLNGKVNALSIDGAGNLYVGGGFTKAGATSVNRVAKWNGSAWHALGSGLNYDVYALGTDQSNNLLVGGAFTTLGDSSLVTAYFATYGDNQVTANTPPSPHETTLSAQISLYPMPALQTVTLKLPASLRGTAMPAEVVDVLGRVVRRYNLSGSPSQVLNVAGLPAGRYTLLLHSKKGALRRALQVQ